MKAQVDKYTFKHLSELDILGMDSRWPRSLHPAGAGEAGAVMVAEETSEKRADGYFILAFP